VDLKIHHILIIIQKYIMIKILLGGILVVAAIGAVGFSQLKKQTIEYKYDYFQSMDNDCAFHYNVIKGLQIGFNEFSDIAKTQEIKVMFQKHEVARIFVDFKHMGAYYPNIFGESRHYEKIIKDSNILGNKYKFFFYPYSYPSLADNKDTPLTFEFLNDKNQVLNTQKITYNMSEFEGQESFPESFSLSQDNYQVVAQSKTTQPYHMVLQWRENTMDYLEKETDDQAINNNITTSFNNPPSYLAALLYRRTKNSSFEYKLQLWNSPETKACLNNNFNISLINN
jgi:hypothetical protein